VTAGAAAIAPLAQAAQSISDNMTPVGLFKAWRKDRRESKQQEKEDKERRKAQRKNSDLPRHVPRDETPAAAEQRDATLEAQASAAAQQEETPTPAPFMLQAIVLVSVFFFSHSFASQDALFATVLSRCAHSLSAQLHRSEALRTGVALPDHFVRGLSSHLLSEWGVQLLDLSITEVRCHFPFCFFFFSPRRWRCWTRTRGRRWRRGCARR
jgi:hypothetical protein